MLTGFGLVPRSGAKAQTPAVEDTPRHEGLGGFPVVAYLPEAGLIGGGYGVYYFDLDGSGAEPVPSSVQALAIASTEGQLGLQLSPELFLDGRNYWLRASLEGRIDPEASFFGLGNETRVDDEESYDQKVLELGVEGRREVVQHLYAGLVVDVGLRTVRNVPAGGLLDALNPVGRDGGFASGLGPSLTWDSRDHVFAPSSGALVDARSVFYSPAFGSEFAFTRLTLDARSFFDLGAGHVLAAQVRLEALVGDGPFDRDAKLGGAELLRGYLRGRFRDDASVGAQLEWRFPIYWRFQGAAFVATGQALGRSRLAPGDFHVAGGVGLRFVLVERERISVRLDAAASPDAIRPYFAPGEAF